MTFNAVVSGTALRPESAPKYMQPALIEMIKSMSFELFQAIDLNLLVKAWKFEGGWMDWFSAILQGLASIFLHAWGYKRTNIVGLSLEQRLIEYFQSQGCTVAESIAMARDIVCEVA